MKALNTRTKIVALLLYVAFCAAGVCAFLYLINTLP